MNVKTDGDDGSRIHMVKVYPLPPKGCGICLPMCVVICPYYKTDPENLFEYVIQCREKNIEPKIKKFCTFKKVA